MCNFWDVLSRKIVIDGDQFALSILNKNNVSLEISIPVALIISRLLEVDSCRSRVLVNAALGRGEIAEALNDILVKHPGTAAAMYAEVGLVSLLGIKPDPDLVSRLKTTEAFIPVVITTINSSNKVKARCTLRGVSLKVVKKIEGQFGIGDEIVGSGISLGTRIKSRLVTSAANGYHEEYELTMPSKADTLPANLNFSDAACRRAAIISKNNFVKALDWLIENKDNPSINAHLFEASEVKSKSMFEPMEKIFGNLKHFIMYALTKF